MTPQREYRIWEIRWRPIQSAQVVGQHDDAAIALSIAARYKTPGRTIIVTNRQGDVVTTPPFSQQAKNPSDPNKIAETTNTNTETETTKDESEYV